MNTQHRLSLGMAILINLNIMMGVGVFINTVELAKRAGILGGFTYSVVGMLMLPLIASIATLVGIYPAGGFYTYARQEISPFAGFIGAWSYFIGKLASSSVGIHVSMLFMQVLFPALSHISTFALDALVISVFTALNMLNLKTGGRIQALFMSFKTLPVFCAIFGGLFLIYGDPTADWQGIWSGIPSCLPLALYAVMGFEAACSISSKIENAAKNAPKAIFISYGIVLAVIVLYQSLFYGALGHALTGYTDYRSAFPGLIGELFANHPQMIHPLIGLLHLGIATSALGGAYGILFSNSWNLHILAQNNHIPFAHIFTQLNKHQIPFMCVVVEGVMCGIYLTITQGNTTLLQQLGGLGTVLAYTMSVCALITAKRRDASITLPMAIPVLGLASCMILISACIRNFLISGIVSLYAFVLLLALGTCMYLYTNKASEVSK